jgi:hypothetical protein
MVRGEEVVTGVLGIDLLISTVVRFVLVPGVLAVATAGAVATIRRHLMHLCRRS